MRDFDFVGTGKYVSAVTVAIAVGLLALLLVRPLNLSIDFIGGTSFLIADVTVSDITSDQLADAARDAGADDVSAQIQTEDGVAIGANVQTSSIEPGSELEQAVTAALAEVTGVDPVDDISGTFVGASWGNRVTAQALEALVVFLILVAMYIALRLEPKMAGVAIAALIHDLALTVGIYGLLGFVVSPATVIALLTILGYSLYDTVVVFDRVQEESVKLDKGVVKSYRQLMNLSLRDVVWRSINTSITSLVPVGCLLFIGSQLLGADTLQDLALALFIGMGAGTFSSIFVAGPLLVWWREREPDMARLKKYDDPELLAAATAEAAAATDGQPVLRDEIVTTSYVRGSGKAKSRKKRKK